LAGAGGASGEELVEGDPCSAGVEREQFHEICWTPYVLLSQS
jgi:hypothetical protein